MKRRVYVLIALMICGVLALGYHAWNGALRDDPLLQSRDKGSLYQFYLTGQPATDGRPEIGTNEAPITLTLVIDFTNKEAYDALVRETDVYVNSSQARRSYKYVLSKEEENTRTGRFIYALASFCSLQEGKNEAETHRMLYAATPTEVESYLKTLGECPSEKHQALLQDAIESDLQRIIAPSVWISVDHRNHIVLYGVPSANQLQQAIRDQQIAIGI